MIVTIDGPAGAGKSSVAKALAERLGFQFLDTGAMYRCVALAALRANADWHDPTGLAELCGRLSIEMDGGKVFLDGDDVTEQIRTPQVTDMVHYVADNPEIRMQLVRWQRELAKGHDIVTEGRDQGTVVFSHAACKIFLTASAEERARRRHKQLQKKGQEVAMENVLATQTERDQRDQRRSFGALRAATDAVIVDTDGQTMDEVVDHLQALVQSRRSD